MKCVLICYNASDTSDDTGTSERRKKDERRWKHADKDGDNVLTRDEFLDFLHPEESDKMKDLVVEVSLLLAEAMCWNDVFFAFRCDSKEDT